MNTNCTTHIHTVEKRSKVLGAMALLTQWGLSISKVLLVHVNKPSLREVCCNITKWQIESRKGSCPQRAFTLTCYVVINVFRVGFQPIGKRSEAYLVVSMGDFF